MLLKALYHSEDFVATALSQQGSPPFPGRFFLVFQTSSSWGNLVLSHPPPASVPLVLPHDFSVLLTSSTNLSLFHFLCTYLFSSLAYNLESRACIFFFLMWDTGLALTTLRARPELACTIFKLENVLVICGRLHVFKNEVIQYLSDVEILVSNEK